MTLPGVDRPAVDAETEVTTLPRRITVSTRVEACDGDLLVVRPSTGEYVDQVVAQVGDEVELCWLGADQVRSAPARVVTVERGAVPRWHLEVTGPTVESQRRSAVRARVTLPLVATVQGAELDGETLDLSEAGIRAALHGSGCSPPPGSVIDVCLDLGDGEVAVRAEVKRLQTRGGRWLLSLRFVETPEKVQDRLRRRVFQALREQRARAAGD